MGDRSTLSAPVTVFVSAIVGRGEEVLLVQRPTGEWAPPTVELHRGERVEDALVRGARALVEVDVNSITFLCLIEDPQGLVLVFDVGVSDQLPDRMPTDGRAAWTNLDALLTAVRVWPWALREAMAAEAPEWYGLGHPRGGR